MKFAHLADVHIGAWRDPRLASLPNESFAWAVAKAIEKQVEFILIAGDLFNTALPGIDYLRVAVRTLQTAKDAGIPVYIIPGSHDFSPSGKSMLHVLEEAGLVVDVFRGSVVDEQLRLSVVKDHGTGCVLTGILGKKGMLDKEHYESLDKSWLADQVKDARHKIFLFHTSIKELRPKSLEQMDAFSVSMLPPGFDYYAGGHVHIVGDVSLEGYPHVVYPGPVFPASFSELESLKQGSMVFFEEGKIERVAIPSKPVIPLSLERKDITPDELTEELVSLVSSKELQDAIVLVRVRGSLREGYVGDVDFRRVVQTALDKGAYVVLRNTAGLEITSEQAQVTVASTAKIEESLIKEFSGKTGHSFGDREEEVMGSLLHALAAEKQEGETNASYDERIVGEAKRLLGL